ncbi:hypothetical protein [Thermococcus sp. M39]|nr:hypothetical protein [Thermococcus sp. M39]
MPTSNLNTSFVIGNYIVVSIPNQGPLSYPYVKECVFQGDRIIIEVYIDNCFVPSSEKSESVCPLYGHEGSSSVLIVGARNFNKFNKIRVNIYTGYELETAKVNNLKLEKTVEFDIRFYSTMFRSLIVVIAFIFVRIMKLLFQRLP